MYMHMFSLCLPPHHHQQWRRPSAASTVKGGRAAFGGDPTFVDSIVGDGEAANIAKTYAHTSNVSLLPHLSPLLLLALRKLRRNWLFANHIYVTDMDVQTHLICLCIYYLLSLPPHQHQQGRRSLRGRVHKGGGPLRGSPPCGSHCW